MNQRKPGFLKIGALNTIPVYVHWSFPFGGIFAALFYHATRHEILYICGAFAVLVILHEAGHALAARLFGYKVTAIELSGVGGLCLTEIPKTRRAAFVIVSAGLIMEFIVLVITYTYTHLTGWPKTMEGASIAFVFIYINGLLIFLNLIPYKERKENLGSDGFLIWALFLQVWNRRPYSFPDTSATIPSTVSLLNRPDMVPEGFEVGIEIFNDNSTPMECVVDALVKHLALPREKAIEMMLSIHNKGGLLIPLETYEQAQKVSFGIMEDARQNGYPLICRPVNVQKKN